MATTIPIPLTNLAANTSIVQTASVPVGTTSAKLSIDRTAGTASLNSLPSDVDVLGIQLEYSLDSGGSWADLMSATTTGGVGPVNFTRISTAVPGDPQSSLRQVRATVQTFASAVSVAGSVVLA